MAERDPFAVQETAGEFDMVQQMPTTSTDLLGLTEVGYKDYQDPREQQRILEAGLEQNRQAFLPITAPPEIDESQAIDLYNEFNTDIPDQLRAEISKTLTHFYDRQDEVKNIEKEQDLNRMFTDPLYLAKKADTPELNEMRARSLDPNAVNERAAVQTWLSRALDIDFQTTLEYEMARNKWSYDHGGRAMPNDHDVFGMIQSNYLKVNEARATVKDLEGKVLSDAYDSIVAGKPPAMATTLINDLASKNPEMAKDPEAMRRLVSGMRSKELAVIGLVEKYRPLIQEAGPAFMQLATAPVGVQDILPPGLVGQSPYAKTGLVSDLRPAWDTLAAALLKIDPKDQQDAIQFLVQVARAKNPEIKPDGVRANIRQIQQNVVAEFVRPGMSWLPTLSITGQEAALVGMRNSLRRGEVKMDERGNALYPQFRDMPEYQGAPA